jgi:RNA polymerase sigma factor (sigma-70 family)
MAFSKKGKEEAAKAALAPAPEAVSELEASQLFTEDPLEALLDEQSDEDFGDLELKERAGKPVKLAEWSAQDFSSIYLRFRPHLERHARRFLRNPSQVDEVVQDAFLYLMVSLPELDSEIGVLRFLKWKTRLLALDVIRASGRAYINSIDDVQEPESNDPEVSSNLEQQDDAAVVRLALSKLNPRHREVLIASMYEEKSTEQIAAQVGLSENATRQLIFRARAAFKKALIGDIDTTGMSAAAILSVAARKAASEGKKVGAAALTLIALVVMSITVFPGLNRATTDQMAEAPVNPGSSESSSQGSVEGNPEAAGSLNPDNSIPESSSPASDNSIAREDGVENSSSVPDPGSVMNANVGSRALTFGERYTAVGANGLTAQFSFDPTAEAMFTDMAVELSFRGKTLEFNPTKYQIAQGKNQQGNRVILLTSEAPYLFDDFGQEWTETVTRNSYFKLFVTLESNGIDIKEAMVSLQK